MCAAVDSGLETKILRLDWNVCRPLTITEAYIIHVLPEEITRWGLDGKACICLAKWWS